MRQELVEVEIKSGKGTKSVTMGGSGETALEMERQRLKEHEAKLRHELSNITEKLENQKIKNTHRYTSMPMIALVGYTNAGKTAVINMSSGSNLESEDRLF